MSHTEMRGCRNIVLPRCTPLHCAASAGEVALVEVLLSRGARATVKDHRGRTPEQGIPQIRTAAATRAILEAASVAEVRAAAVKNVAASSSSPTKRRNPVRRKKGERNGSLPPFGDGRREP